jgi:hypothetical protein
MRLGRKHIVEAAQTKYSFAGTGGRIEASYSSGQCRP